MRASLANTIACCGPSAPRVDDDDAVAPRGSQIGQSWIVAAFGTRPDDGRSDVRSVQFLRSAACDDIADSATLTQVQSRSSEFTAGTAHACTPAVPDSRPPRLLDAVRQAIRPLGALAAAADALDPNRKGPPLSERGPSEVAHAARAFNAMRERIAHYLEERVQILAAISHDLQTPITRMRLRADMADDSPEKDKLVRDLGEIERLVQDGIAYARSAHGNGEKFSRIDLSSFIDSIAYDYQDMDKAVEVIVHLCCVWEERT